MALSEDGGDSAGKLGPEGGEDSDMWSIHSDYSSDIDDDLFAGAPPTKPSWQQLHPMQFSVTSTQESLPPEGHTEPATSEIYRDVTILDYAARDGQDLWIRLLEIRPGTLLDPIHGKLIKRPLWDAGEYFALSYSWGKAPFDREIFIESRKGSSNRFPLTTHLQDALRRLRDEQCGLRVWVDAICIDQQNDVERAEQVNIMAQIFNQASQVRVWLGEVHISEGAEHLDAELFRSLSRQPDPWWERLWVVQECAYAEKCPVVMIGAIVVDFQQLVERWQSAASIAGGLHEVERKTLTIGLESMRSTFNVWHSQKAGNGHRLPLLHRLREMADRICSDPHDRIYALLSLIDEEEAETLRPDYRKPVADLLLEVAQVLRRSGDWHEERDSDLFRLLHPEPWVLTALLQNKSPKEYHDALVQAMFVRNRKVIEVLMHHCVDTHVDQKDWNRALKVASQQGFKDVVQLLLISGASAYKDEQLGHVLVTASKEGNETAVEKLINAGANVNSGNKVYSNALQAASFKGKEAIVTRLIDAGANINVQGGHFGTALAAASQAGHVKTVRILIEAGAVVDDPQETGRALYEAVSGGHVEVVKALIDAGAKVNVNAQNRKYGSALQAASYQGNETIVKRLVDAGGDINLQGGHFGNALQAASFQGNEIIMKTLIDAGADINAQGGKYSHALQAACFRGNSAVVKGLIAAGANVNAEGRPHRNALQVASVEGREKIVKMLLSAGADVNANISGNTALQAAARKRHTKVAKVLLSAGANVNAHGGVDGNALQAASVGGSKAIVKVLLKAGAEVNAGGGHYNNALDAAFSEYQRDIVRMLLDAGADNGEGKERNEQRYLNMLKRKRPFDSTREWI